MRTDSGLDVADLMLMGRRIFNKAAENQGFEPEEIMAARLDLELNLFRVATRDPNRAEKMLEGLAVTQAHNKGLGAPGR